MRKGTRRQNRKKSKHESRGRSKIPGSFRLTWQTLQTLGRHWKSLGGIVLVYLVLNIVFASGLSSISQNISSIKDNLDNSGASLGSALSGFGVLFASVGTSGSGAGSALQSVLIVLESLVIIWALRQLLAGQAIRVKQAYYSSMYPLIPFLLVVFVMIIQLLPLTIGSVALNLVLSSIILNTTWLTVVFGALFAVLAAWSLYMISSSVFALYIVTLPDMQPRQALRSARNLVRFRRLAIMRRALFLPIFLLIAFGAIIVPLILFATIAVAPVFYLLSMVAILFVHTYLYSLYRSLL